MSRCSPTAPIASRVKQDAIDNNKVMQVENDYDKEVYDGDLGVVRSIDPEASEMVIEFDGRGVTFGSASSTRSCSPTLRPFTSRKAPSIRPSVIPLTTQHYPMLQRNLLYTAVTRGKRLVVIVGQKKALAIAVKGKQTGRRWSKLREWLHEACADRIAPRGGRLPGWVGAWGASDASLSAGRGGGSNLLCSP